MGRQGHQNFPHGIDILTAADYFTLGVRSNAYLKISTFVAGFEKYRKALITHVYEVKLFHWDIQIRELASKTLNKMTPLDPSLIADTAIPSLLPYTTSPDLLKRHGSILGIAECLQALSDLGHTLPDDMVSDIVSVVPQIEKARLYRGRGGEIVRQACCRLLECVAIAQLPLPVKMQLRLLDSIDESVKHAMEPVQLQAVAALRVFMRSYFPLSDGKPSPRLQARVVDKYAEIVSNADIASSTRGFALALGCLPAQLVSYSQANLEKVVETLRVATRPDFRVGEEPDAETRRNAINALVEVYCEVGAGGGQGVSQVKTMAIYDALVYATRDYSMDKRGDVGSWSRIAAMNGLEKVMLAALKTDSQSNDTSSTAASTADSEVKFVTSEMMAVIVSCILKQLCEKLDNVRAKAGSVVERLISIDCPISHLVPNRDELDDILTPKEGELAVNWALASETYPKMMKIMELPIYHDAIVAGLILSVGGLTEAVVKSSSKSLLEWTKSKKLKKEFEPLTKLSHVLLSLFSEHAGEDRVILPLMKTLELLLEAEVFDFLCCATPPTFGVDLLSKVKKELHRSTNVVKLFTGLNIALSLLKFSSELSKVAMALLLELLGHRYPRVRKHAAEQFYTKLIIDDRLVDPEVYDLVLSQLSLTVWDADVASARQERNEIAAAVGVALVENVTAPKKTKAKAKDELDSYQHLVNEVGY